MAFDPVEAQRSSRALVMQDRLARQQHEEEQAALAAKQQPMQLSTMQIHGGQPPVPADKGGQPIKDTAPKVDPIKVASDAVAAADKSVREKEKTAAIDFMKYKIPAFVVGVEDFIGTAYNKINDYTRPLAVAMNALTGATPPPAYDSKAPFGGEWMRDKIMGPHPTNEQVLAWDTTQWGMDPVTMMAGAGAVGMKIVGAVGGAAKAGLIPVAALHDGQKLLDMMNDGKHFISQMQKEVFGSDEWLRYGRLLWQKTGMIMDTEGHLFKHVATDHVNINPKFMNPDGTLGKVPAGATLKDVLNTTDFLAELHPDFKRMIEDTPVADLRDYLPTNLVGQADERGITFGGAIGGVPGRRVAGNIFHETFHIFQSIIGTHTGTYSEKFYPEFKVPEKKTLASDSFKETYRAINDGYFRANGKYAPSDYMANIVEDFNVYGRAIAEGKLVDPVVKSRMEEYLKLDPFAKETLKNFSEFFAAGNLAFMKYETSGGEFYARLADRADKLDIFPFDVPDPSGYTLADVHNNGPGAKMKGVPGYTPGTGKRQVQPFPTKLALFLDARERVLKLAVSKGIADPAKIPTYSAEEVDKLSIKLSDMTSDDEIRQLFAEQRADMLSAGSKWDNEYANKTLQEQVKERLDGLTNARQARENPNAGFPSKGRDPKLDPTWDKRRKELGLTPADVERMNEQAAGGREALAQSRRDQAEKVRTFASGTGTDAKGGVTKADAAMRVPDSQGVKGPQSGGLPPKEPGGYGELLDQAGLMATGGKVWPGGTYNPEAAINRATRTLGERIKTVNKTFDTSAEARRKSTPTFWAYDEDKKLLLQVRADPNGTYKIVDRKKQGKLPEGWRNYVDEFMTEEDLTKAINKATLEHFGL